MAALANGDVTPLEATTCRYGGLGLFERVADAEMLCACRGGGRSFMVGIVIVPPSGIGMVLLAGCTGGGDVARRSGTLQGVWSVGHGVSSGGLAEHWRACRGVVGCV